MSKPQSSFARAALPALVIGGAAGALLIGLDRPDSAQQPLTEMVPADTTANPTTDPAGGATDDSASDGTTATASTDTAAATTTAPPADASTCTSVTGPAIDTRFGPVQVAAAVSTGGAICDVEILQYPSSDRRSLAISNQALPTLIERTLAAQSAAVDTVSGATYTSTAYVRSLQAILDSVGA